MLRTQTNARSILVPFSFPAPYVSVCARACALDYARCRWAYLLRVESELFQPRSKMREKKMIELNVDLRNFVFTGRALTCTSHGFIVILVLVCVRASEIHTTCTPRIRTYMPVKERNERRVEYDTSA